MVKKMIIKKVIIASVALFALALFCFIPKDNTNSLESIDQELEYVDKEIKTHNIFLLDSNNYLGLTKVVVDNNDTNLLIKELMEILIKDGVGESKIPNGFKSFIPIDTIINNITVNDKVLKLDLSKELLDVNKELEEKVIESIVFTMTSIKDIDKVILYIDGEILSKLPQSGKILPSSLDRNYGINKRYDLSNINDILGVTVYYINEYNNKYYYVPVTSYLNDNRDRISIIVDELNSNFIYSADLMSFLNEDVRLLKSTIKDDTMILEFNNAIFNSLNEKSILEEVLYTIALSVGDNYNVKEVLFQVGNEEICKKSIE